VLADASDEDARRMVTEASAGVLAYGHIHSTYQWNRGLRPISEQGSSLLRRSAIGLVRPAPSQSDPGLAKSFNSGHERTSEKTAASEGHLSAVDDQRMTGDVGRVI
jgi:hypothetical protein